MKYVLIASTFCLGIMSSCSLFYNEQDKEVVARVYDKYLYKSDLIGVVPEELSEEDSTLIAENYINNWGKAQLVLYKAELNLTEEKKSFEKQLQDYRNDLVTHAYKQELIRQKLDTNISEQEIEEYFNAHPENFKLKENIVKAFYLTLDKAAPKLSDVKRWYKSSKKEDYLSLQDYCIQFATSFNLNDSIWMSYNDLLKFIPIEGNQEQFLRSTKFYETQDSLSLYFLRIEEYKIKNSTSPLQYVKPTVKSIIINQRKLELISKMEEELVEKALNKKNFEIY